jgi:adenosylcobinamide-GDP ribazoletransferase
LLISWLPGTHAAAYLVATPVLSRWTALPLSFFLAPTGTDGQGARIARLTSAGSLALGSVFALVLVLAFLRVRGLVPVLAAILVTFVSGSYYQRRLGGITGDCFGATSQLTELAVLFCGVWV